MALENKYINIHVQVLEKPSKHSLITQSTQVTESNTNSLT